MEKTTSRYSFRRILETPTDAHKQYVLSESRYTGLLEFLENQVGDLSGSQALDIGCGGGVISRGLARKCGQAIGVDGNSDNIALANTQAHEEGVDNVIFKTGSATNLPLDDESVDIAIINGVLEWVGTNDHGQNPKDLQRRALREAHRVLRRDGILYLGIENRWHPATLVKDPHTRLTAVNALPRPLANMVSRLRTGKPFQAYIYGGRSYTWLLQHAGFRDIAQFVPFPSYQYPGAFVRLCSKQACLQDIDALDIDRIREIRRQSARKGDIDHALKRLRQKASLGLLGLLAHDLAFVVKK